ncbi:EamA family transporter [Paenibacillus sp. EPM92]|uniref:EamA family transporter n=1 Tax=Paenibacillus sp. EPM92 TaxID=1561195 RepID=UPI002738F2F2|nr:EamA family transporter [Paenibacillus sp. EPM92]
MLVLRGVLGALYLIAYFYTISKIPLTDASILAHLSPIFVIIMSAIFLKENISGKIALMLPIIFIGALLLVKPFDYSSYSVYAFVGVLSAMLGQLYLTKAFTHEKAVVVEVTRYIGIVYNAMRGFLFWGEVPGIVTIAGGVLIVAGCMALSRVEPA